MGACGSSAAEQQATYGRSGSFTRTGSFKSERSGSFWSEGRSGSFRIHSPGRAAPAPVLLGKTENRAPPPLALPELKKQEKLMEPETPYNESALKMASWEGLDDDEEEDESLPPLPQAGHLGWVARRRQEDSSAMDRSADFLALLQDVRNGTHALDRRWDLTYLLVPGFFCHKYPTYMKNTKNHLRSLGLDCRTAEIDASQSVDTNAVSLAEQVEELSVRTGKRVVLVGHSRGGCDAVAAVARYSDRLKERVAGVLCLQAPLGGTPLAGDFAAKRLRGRVLRAARFALGAEVDALNELTYEMRMEEIEAYPFPASTPVVTFSSETSRQSGLLEPLATHMSRKYLVANDGLASSVDAHLPNSTMVAFTGEWDHAACAFRATGQPDKDELVNEALLTLLVQEVPMAGPCMDTSLTPIYNFWNRVRREHTFHHGDPWTGERRNGVAFYAYSCEVDGTDPIFCFWNKEYSVHTFHMGPAAEGEAETGIQFYAFRHPTDDAEPVFSFWHEENADYTVHMGDPRPGETRREVLFYAFRHPGPLYGRPRMACRVDRV